MFENSKFNNNSISNWDVSQIEDFDSMFEIKNPETDIVCRCRLK